MNYTEKIDYYSGLLPSELTESRFRHCLKVAEISEKLAIANHYEQPEAAYLAGLIHDITKQKKKEFHQEIFRENNFDEDSIPQAAWHAYSGSFYLKNGIENREILAAVRSHTLGNSAMGLLEQIVYAADFLGSDFALKKDKWPNWLKKTEKNLLFGLYLKSSSTIAELLEKKASIHPFTLATYNFSLSLPEPRNSLTIKDK